MRKLCLISVLSLSACGGGGGSTPQSNSPVSNPTSVSAPQETVYYREIKNAIPSLAIYYERTCGKAANSFLVPAVDTNKDNRKDLFIVLWCGVSEHGMVYDGPVKNTVISLLQNNDGTYRLGNLEIFGKEFVELAGAIAEGSDVGVGDFNGDGRDDIALSTTLEDGRRFIIFPDGSHSWNSYPEVMLSQPDGTYKIERLGNRNTYNSITIMKGKDRDRFESGGYIWSYENQKWSGSTVNYLADRTSVYIDNLMTMNLFDSKNFGWQIGNVDASNYTKTDFINLSELRKVEVYNDNVKGNTIESLATIDNVEYLMPSYNSVCTLPGSNANEVYIVAEFQGIKLPEKYTGQKLSWSTPNVQGNVTWDNYITRVHMYKVSNGKLTKVNIPGFNRDITNSHYISCLDVNNDNQKDVVVYRWGHKQEKSVIYLNKNNTDFTEVPSSKIPDISTVYFGHTTLTSDLDNDSKAEIIYGPGLGYPKEYAGNYSDYQIYKAVSPL